MSAGCGAPAHSNLLPTTRSISTTAGRYLGEKSVTQMPLRPARPVRPDLLVNNRGRGGEVSGASGGTEEEQEEDLSGADVETACLPLDSCLVSHVYSTTICMCGCLWALTCARRSRCRCVRWP